METSKKLSLLKWASLLNKRLMHIKVIMDEYDILYRYRDLQERGRLIYLPDYIFDDEICNKINSYISSFVKEEDKEEYIEDIKSMHFSADTMTKLLKELTSTTEDEYQHDEEMFNDETTVPGLLAKYYSKIYKIQYIIEQYKDILEEFVKLDFNDTIESELFNGWNPDDEA